MSEARRFRGYLRRIHATIRTQVDPNREQMGLQPSPAVARAVVWSLIGTTGIFISWLSLAKTDEVVVAPGQLVPIGNVKIVQMPAGGVLKELMVEEGQSVSQGQVLLTLDNEASLDRQVSISQGIAAKSEQLSLKNLELNRYLNLNDAEQQVLLQNIALEQQILDRLAELRKSGASAELQVLQQRNRVRDIEGQLKKVRLDRFRQIAILEQQIQEIAASLADLKSKLTELNVNLRYQNIASPVDGLVFDLKPKGVGFVAQASEPVMKIVPFSDLQAKVNIDSSDIGFVRIGKEVDISIDSFPASDFGVLGGRLKSISSDALPPDQLNPSYRYPSIISLDTQFFKLNSGQRLPLQVGMSLTANIKLRKVSYLQLLLGGFRDKTDALRRLN